jgi:hypothetical protein
MQGPRIHLFICTLFNDAFFSVTKTMSNERVDDELERI